MNTQKIIPHLWYDQEAKVAAELYTSLFPNSRITNLTTLTGTPSGDADIVSFELWGCSFMAISAGPLFKFNPSISFMVNFDPAQDKDARERIDQVYNKLYSQPSSRTVLRYSSMVSIGRRPMLR